MESKKTASTISYKTLTFALIHYYLLCIQLSIQCSSSVASAFQPPISYFFSSVSPISWHCSDIQHISDRKCEVVASLTRARPSFLRSKKIFGHKSVLKISRQTNPRDTNTNADKSSLFSKEQIFDVGHFVAGRRGSRRRKAARHFLSVVKSSLSMSSNSSEEGNASFGSKISRSKSISVNALSEKLSLLEEENETLRKDIAALQEKNVLLESRQAQQRIVIEQFEGEGRPTFNVNGEEVDTTWWEEGKDHISEGTSKENHDQRDAEVLETEKLITKSSSDQESDELCDIYDEDACPTEPDVSFKDALRDRAYWLVGLLVLQSMSGFILARNEELLQAHPVIVYFLTMLVGAGGNAGNQASVRVIRGIALGTLNESTQRKFLNRELKMAFALSSILSIAGFARAIAFRTPIAETIAITAALSLIVFSSICMGALLPLLLKKIGVDPAHSSTTIQVVMDIMGVVLTVIVSTAILDSALGQLLVSKLPFL